MSGPPGGFRRTLSFGQLLGLSLGGIIGSGWLFAVLDVAGTAGPAAFVSWAVGGGITLLIAVCWAELAGVAPRTGASVRYPFWSHGPVAGFWVGWIRLLSVVTIPAIEAEAVVSALQAMFDRFQLPWQVTSTAIFDGARVTVLDPAGTAIAFALMAGFFGLNVGGIRLLGRFNAYVTVWKVVVPAAAVLSLAFLLRPDNLSGAAGGGGLAPYGLAAVFLAIPAGGVMFAYLGFVQVIDYGEEAKDPARDLPRSILLAVVLTIVVYTGLQLTFSGAVNWAALGLSAGDWAALPASSWAALPVYSAVASGPGPWWVFLALVLLVDGSISPSGTGWIYLGAAARATFGIAEEGFLPPAVSRLGTRSGVPVLALLVSLGIGAVFLLPLPSWYELVGFISLGTVLVYGVGAVIVAVFRARLPAAPRPFRIRALPVVAPAAFAATAVTLYWGGFTLMSWFMVAAFSGIALFLLGGGADRLGIDRVAARVAGAATVGLLAVLVVWGPLYDAGVGLAGSRAAGNTWLWSRAALGPDVMYFVGWAALTVGVVVFLDRASVPAGRRDVRASAWIPLWLLGTYGLSYLGEFGPRFGLGPSATTYPGAAVLAFPWGSVAAAAFGLVIYVLAVRSGTGPLTEARGREGTTIGTDVPPRPNASMSIHR